MLFHASDLAGYCGIRIAFLTAGYNKRQIDGIKTLDQGALFFATIILCAVEFANLSAMDYFRRQNSKF